MLRWIPIRREGPLPADWQDVLIGWDQPRRHWPRGPRVQSATFRDFKKEYPDDDGPRMFGHYPIGEPNSPTHWAELPAAPGAADCGT